jgi:hypothetical protein
LAVQSGTPSALIISAIFEATDIYQQGIVAGVIGAATVAIWFFIIDVSTAGRSTRRTFSAALFRHGSGLNQPHALAISLEMVLVYTWVHGMAFCVIGGFASKLLALAERNLNLGFGIVLLFVIFEFGFVGAAFIFAEPILQVLAWPAVLVGNLLAATGMAGYFWRHHPNLTIEP